MTGRPETARALVLTEPRQIGFRDLEVPRPETDCALLRVEACGLCGTDHEMYTGHLPAAVPLVPGHETVGVIEEVGQAAAARWQVGVGDRVAIVIDGGQQKGMPHRRFQGRSGVITGQQGRAWVVAVKDGNMAKTVISRPEHLRPLE